MGQRNTALNSNLLYLEEALPSPNPQELLMKMRLTILDTLTAGFCFLPIEFSILPASWHTSTLLHRSYPTSEPLSSAL